MARAPFTGVYGNMEFPEYKFQEFPKLLKLPSGREVRVDNQREELNAIAEDEQIPKHDLSPVVAERDELAGKLAEAQDNHAAAQTELEKLQAELAELKAKLGVEGKVEPEPQPEPGSPLAALKELKIG